MQEEKVAIVTGSSTGIGFETSLAFTRSGFLPMPHAQGGRIYTDNRNSKK